MQEEQEVPFRSLEHTQESIRSYLSGIQLKIYSEKTESERKENFLGFLKKQLDFEFKRSENLGSFWLLNSSILIKLIQFIAIQDYLKT